jgi:type IV pilus assembly protein PilP
MKKKQEALQLLAYTGVAALGVGAAFIVAMQFMGKSRAQDEGATPAPPAAEESAATHGQPATPPPSEEAPAAAAQAPAAPDPNLGGVQPSPDAHVKTTAAPAPSESGSGGGLAEIEGFLEPYIYDVVNRRDPFLAYAEFVPSDEGPSRPMSPAQRFAIEDLKLVGIMWDVKEPRALFQDPENEILPLSRDDSIGNRNGYIAAIREGEVVVVEAIRKKGDIIYRTKVLRIER